MAGEAESPRRRRPWPMLGRLPSVPLLLLLWQLPGACEGKFQAGPMRISGPKKENHWKYVSKFGYGLGTGKFNLRVKLQSPRTISAEAKLMFEVFLDEDWAEVEAMEDICKRRDKARQRREIMVNPEGEWGEWVNGSLAQSQRPHIWYFAISDCDGALQNFTHRLRFEFKATQDTGSEFSIEMGWMPLANFVFLCGISAFVWKFIVQTRSFSRSSGSVHPVIWTLSVAIVLQFIAQVFHTIHLWVYAYDGNGVKAMEVLSEILFMLSQVTQTSLLILIALGYTLLQSKIGELDLMIPMCFMVGVIHIMLVGFGKIKDDASYKYHENEGVVGWVLLVMRLLLYVWFLWAVQSSASEGGMKLQTFLRQYRAAGSLYFLAYPFIFIITKCFAPYWQHLVMAIGLMSMQMGSNLWLASLFLTRGEYFKVSTLSASSLPGGSAGRMVKEE
mmetsp:Transcript_101155/g.325892  ORF Transcript_101155/g.325892 Transcript_101155/m.325892 type:complete len:445 (-) Transcript_101155:138-1472(-)